MKSNLFVGVIGKGEWGKKVIYNLKNYCKPYLIDRSFKDINKLKEINFFFIITPVKSHYHIINKILKLKNKIIFCEKPLTTNLYKTKKIFNIANLTKSKIYISDIFNYHSSKIKFKNINFILRNKYSPCSHLEIIDKFLYHDLSLINKKLKLNTYQKLIIKKNEPNKLKIILVFKNFTFNIFYDLTKKKKVYTFNNYNLLKNKNILNDLLRKFLKNKVNFKKNNESYLKIQKLTDKIKNIIK